MSEENQWKTMREAAKILKTSESRLSRLAASGVIQTKPSPIDRRKRLVNVDEIRRLFTTYEQ